MSKITTDLMAAIEAMSEDEKAKAHANRFAYIFGKAHLYLQLGPEKYRKQDFFGRPVADLDQDKLDLIEKGCHQVLAGKGLTPDKPFEELGIEGFYLLFELFHFDLAKQYLIGYDRDMLDHMRMFHEVENYEVEYYNLVVYEGF